MKYLKGTWRVLLLLACAVSLLIYSFLGERGFMNVLSMREELKRIEHANSVLKQENEALQEQSSLLKNDTYAIESIAREDLNLLKPGEVVYFFEDD